MIYIVCNIKMQLIQVINTPTLTLPHPGGGNSRAHQVSPLPWREGDGGRGIKKQIPIQQ